MAKVATKAAPKTKAAVKEADANALLSMLNSEQSARALSRSTNRDKKLNKFINGEFKEPTIFKGNNFAEFIKDNEHILEKDNKQALLNNIIGARIDNEVEEKVATFYSMPLDAKAKAKLEAAKSQYKSYLSNLARKAKAMLNELAKVK